MTQTSPLIMLAEDDADYSFLFQQACEDLGFLSHSTLVQYGDEVITVLSALKQQPDLLFLDINMPRKSGIVVLQEIRNNSNWDSMAVIMLTNSNEKGHVAGAYESGANFYLHKPSDYKTYRNMLKRVLHTDKQNLLSKRSAEEFLLSEQEPINPGN